MENTKNEKQSFDVEPKIAVPEEEKKDVYSSVTYSEDYTQGSQTISSNIDNKQHEAKLVKTKPNIMAQASSGFFKPPSKDKKEVIKSVKDSYSSVGNNSNVLKSGSTG